MKIRSAVLVAALVFAASAALAQQRRPVDEPNCVPNYPQRTLMGMLFSTGPTPQANGCAPPVYSGGRFVGQDPDPNVRLQMLRDADNEGYHLNTK